MNTMLKTTDRTASAVYGKYKNVKTAVVLCGGGMEIRYRLLLGFIGGTCVCSLLISLFENGILSDEEFIFNISADQHRAESIFRKVCENAVTPCTAYECLDVILDTVI